jgi:hypothetical protein
VPRRILPGRQSSPVKASRRCRASARMIRLLYIRMRPVMARAYNNVIDADGHILEPLDLWDKYIDPAFRERRPRFVIDENGKERLKVEGKLLGNPRGINLKLYLGTRASTPPGSPGDRIGDDLPDLLAEGRGFELAVPREMAFGSPRQPDGHCQLERPWCARRVGGVAARVRKTPLFAIMMPAQAKRGRRTRPGCAKLTMLAGFFKDRARSAVVMITAPPPSATRQQSRTVKG